MKSPESLGDGGSSVTFLRTYGLPVDVLKRSLQGSMSSCWGFVGKVREVGSVLCCLCCMFGFP